jgi:hypothetical protein
VTAIATERLVDLRREALSDLRAIDFRSPSRDYWADEAAVHDRFVAVWAGLDEAAWRLPGAAPSDAGGADRLRAAIQAMRDDEWLDPEGCSWACEDLHGHVRAHHAMIGPWAARLGRPQAANPEEDR